MFSFQLTVPQLGVAWQRLGLGEPPTIWAHGARAAAGDDPLGQLHDADRELDELGLDRGVKAALARGNGSDAAVADELVLLGLSEDDVRGLMALTGGRRMLYGQFGVTVADPVRGRRRGAEIVQVVDTRAGRAAMSTFKYEDIRGEAARLRDIPPPGKDDVSTRTAIELGALAGDRSGQLGWCAEQARTRVQEMIDQVNGIINTYRNVEDANEMGQ